MCVANSTVEKGDQCELRSGWGCSTCMPGRLSSFHWWKAITACYIRLLLPWTKVPCRCGFLPAHLQSGSWVHKAGEHIRLFCNYLHSWKQWQFVKHCNTPKCDTTYPQHNGQLGRGHSMILRNGCGRFNDFFKSNVQQTHFDHNYKCMIITGRLCHITMRSRKWHNMPPLMYCYLLQLF